MTYLVGEPLDFAADSLAGFVSAHSDLVQAVHGGVVRADASPQGEVAVVVGGGSGHYPAFSGWVGQGMAHGSVCGNIFASPSDSQVVSVARADSKRGGVLLPFGRYALRRRLPAVRQGGGRAQRRGHRHPRRDDHR